jgi:hypothetical protein
VKNTPFGITRGAGGVEQRRDRVFVEVREPKPGRRGGNQGLVISGQGQRRGRRLAVVAERNPLADTAQLRRQPLGYRQEIGVEEDERVLRVEDGEGDLLGREADVHRVQHGAQHGQGEKQFEVTVTVPIHHAHPVTRPDAQIGECLRQAFHALEELGVGVLALIAVNDLLLRRPMADAREQVTDEQRLHRSGHPGGRRSFHDQ